MNLAALSAAIFAGSLSMSIEAPGVSVGQPAAARPSPAFSNNGTPSTTSLGATAPRVVIGDMIRNEDAYGGDGSFLVFVPTPLITFPRVVTIYIYSIG